MSEGEEPNLGTEVNGPNEENIPDFVYTSFDVEWVTLNSLREVIGVAQKQTPTYLETLGVGIEIAPELFSVFPRLLGAKESTFVRLYRQKAQTMSEKFGKVVTPIQAIDEDIEEYENLLTNPPESVDIGELRSFLAILQGARRQLERENYTETQCIFRDARDVFDSRGLDVIDIGKTYKDFLVSSDRALRIRVLHPDPPEQILGADVVYESHWGSRGMARIAVLQYKMWNGKVLYAQQAGNIADQLSKLKQNFCSKGYCQSHPLSNRKDSYRLPFCTAFLRPTDKIQPTDHRFLSTGYHVPICVVEKCWAVTEKGNKKLERKMFRSEAVTQKVFEELFNTGMLGSRWLTYTELADLYKGTGVLNNSRNIRIYAQEYGDSKN